MTSPQPNQAPPPATGAPIDRDDEVAAVRTEPTGSGRGSATRWGIALLVVALVVGLVAAAIFLLAGREAPSGLVGYAPADATAYSEVRLDLPGDQRQKLGEVLARFPGFADQSTLDAKLEEAFDRLVRLATENEQDYLTKIKPWFGGQLAFASGALPQAVPSDGMPADGHGLLLATVKDGAAARAWFTSTVGDVAQSTDTYKGVEITTLGDRRVAVAVLDEKVLLAGDDASVRAAIDGGGTGGLQGAERFRAAEEALAGDSIASFWIDSGAWAQWMATVGAGTTGDPAVGAFAGRILTDRIPPWIAGQLRAEGDALVLETVNPHVDAGPARTNRVSNVADNLPSSTIAVLDLHDVGAGLQDVVAQLRSAPGAEEAFRSVDTALGLIGGFDALLGWIGDSALVVTREGETVGGGLVVAPTDAGKATSFIATLRSLILLGGGQAGMTTREESYNGATITYVTTGGLGGGVGQVPSEVAFTATDQLVAIGAGESFVKSVLDANGATSLAGSERYRAAMERVGTENILSFWVDLAAARELGEATMRGIPGSDAQRYDTEIRPYVTPFDTLVGASRLDGELDRTTIVLGVR